MGLNKKAKLIPFLVLVLGLVAAVGMYLHVKKGGQTHGNASLYPSVSPVPNPQIPGNWPIVTPGSDPESTWLKALNTEYGGQFVGLDHGVTAIAWPVTPAQSETFKAMGPGYDFWAGLPMLFTSILSSATSTENGVDKVYMLVQTQYPIALAHSAQALLGGAVLTEKDGTWNVELTQRYITLGGTFGQFAAPTVISIGRSHPAFQLLDESVYQGAKSGNITIYAFVKGSFHGVLGGTLSDNRGFLHIERLSFKERISQLGTSIDTNFEPIPSAKEYYDIRAITTETQYLPVWSKTAFGGEWKVTNAIRTVNTYYFNGEEYVKTGS